MKQNILDEIIGWYGTAAIIIAYATVSFNLATTSTFFYQILNSTGALAIVYISFKKKAYQPAVLNIIWTIIALIGMIRLL